MNSTLDMTRMLDDSLTPVKPATQTSTERKSVCRHAYPKHFLPPDSCMYIHDKVKCGVNPELCDWEVE